MIEKLIRGTGEWLAASGPESDIVLTTRVRLARNLAAFPFTSRATLDQMEAVREQVLAAAKDTRALGGAIFFDLPLVPDLEKQILIERHLVSHNLVAAPAGGALIKPDEVLSVMINEEDHLRITAFTSGLQLRQAWEAVNEVDDLLDARLPFAFDPEWGYLTACPTNTGTGMRASVLVHLPGLVLAKRMNTILKGVSQLGLSARGYYGEGTDSIGGFYQFSNQVTLGKSESDILAEIEQVTHRIIQNETTARRQLYAEDKARLEDQVWRAYGTLKSARVLSAEEAMDILSDVRLGINMGIVPEVDMHVLNEIFLNAQPAHLQYYGGQDYTPEQQDFLRAKYIRERLTG